MDRNIESPLTETTFLILLALQNPNHGYGIRQFVEEKTNGRVVFGPGTLYGALNNLEKKGWIAEYQKEDRRTDYVITEIGNLCLKAERLRMVEVLEIADAVMEEVEK